MKQSNGSSDPPTGNDAFDAGPGGTVALRPAAPVPLDPYRNPYAAVDESTRDDLSAIVRDLLAMVMKRKWLIVGVTLAFIAINAARTMMITPLYVATVRLQIDRTVPKIIEAGQVSPAEGLDGDFLRTQHELLLSRAMAERVATALRLGEDTDFFKPRDFSLLGWARGLLLPAPPQQQRQSPASQEMDRAAAGIVTGNRSVRPVPGARLVDVIYQDPNPARAARIANAFGEQFIGSSLDKRFQANAFAKAFLEDQVNALKARLEEAERAVLEFAEREQIIVVTEKASIAETNLAAANAALGTLISERIKNEQLWRQVEKSSALSFPQLLANKAIEDLRARRSALATEYQEKLEIFKPAFPTMVQISNRIRDIDRQIEAEVALIKDSLKAAYQNSVNQEQDLKARIEALRLEVLDLQKRSIQHNILKREVDTTRALYHTLLQRSKEVDIAGGSGSNNVFIVDSAQVPGGPSSPVMSRALLNALLLGLGFALALTYLLERLDDRLHTPDVIERNTGLVTLGIIPRFDPATFDRELEDPASMVSEAYRSLCTSLQFSSETGLPKCLLITSAGPGEGKSTSSMAIATHFARIGLKVLVVDADLRNPSLHLKLGLENTIGLSNYLTGACSPPDAFQRTGHANLAFMASGPPPPNAADLLGSTRMGKLISLASEVFDLIVVDAPPVMGLADALVLSSATSATVFVVGAGQARAGQVRHALSRLRQMARAPLIGTLVTKFDAKSQSYGYGYGYGYGAGYGYGYQYGGQRVRPPAQIKSHADGGQTTRT